MAMAVLPCKACTKNCYAIHGSKIKHQNRNNECTQFHNSLQFFKVMIGDFEARLQIPPAFIAKLRVNEMGIDENVVLQGPTTHKWTVKLYGTSKGMELVKGWDKFVLHHRIEFGDFLLFKYVSRSIFKVTIFGATACEKNYLQPTCLATCFTSQEDKEVDGGIVSSKGRNLKSAFGECHFQSPKHTNQYMVKKGIQNAEKKLGGMYYVSCRRPVTREERGNALKAAYSFRSINPFYSVVMKTSHVYRNFWLTFSKKNGDHLLLPRERAQVSLVDTNNKEWHVQYLGNTSRPALRGGWKHFSSENNLEEGDVCVFERVGTSEHKLRVHIFRVVENCIPYKTVESSIKPMEEEDIIILETHQLHKEVNTDIATKKRKADANVATKKGKVNANVATKKRKSNKDVAGKKMRVNTHMKQIQGKQARVSTSIASGSSKFEGCRRSKRFLNKENNWERQNSIDQSTSIICIEDDEEKHDGDGDDDVMIIWDIKNPSLAMPMPLSSSSGAFIPYEKAVHTGIPQVENTVVPVSDPELKALSLVVALSPEEATSQIHMNGNANMEAGSTFYEHVDKEHKTVNCIVQEMN